ncbi:SusC/RagA family TonB-linked outer membrane protein [Niastella vici]|nr:SusC/RagA family TonB-linked outer membrane protein [Niastella vici]
MKLTNFFLLVAVLNVSAKGLSQTITFSGKNVPLQQVFVEIKKQTGYGVICNADLLDQTSPVSISVKKAPLEDFLVAVLKDQHLEFSITKTTIVISKPAVAITADRNRSGTDAPAIRLIDIHGQVVNEKGEPIERATVEVKGIGKGTVTNAKGDFVLTNVEPDATLIISSVSYVTQEFKLNGRTNFTITMVLNADKLNETVVTAYGIEKRTKELGYSAIKVSGAEINRTNPANLLTGLTGKVSGLSISTTGAGVNPQIRVLLRGIRSFSETTNNLPLFILNGSPLSFGADQQAANILMDFINNINPNDIESVNILKGANGAALYGPEGVNGVIIINTKKGKLNPVVSYVHSTMLQTLDTKYPKIQKRFGSGAAVDQFGQGIYDPNITQSWGPEFNGEMVSIGRPDENGEQQMVPYKYTKERFRFYNVGITAQNNISVSQGDNRSDYYLSAGHTYITGLKPDDRTSRASLLLNAGRQFGKISTRVNMGYTKSHANLAATLGLEPLFFPAHIPITRYKDFRNDKWSDHNHYWADGVSNPYEDIGTQRLVQDNNALFGNLSIIMKPARWLTVTNRIGMNYYGIVEKITKEPILYSDFGRTNGRSISAKGDIRASVIDEHKVNLTLNNDLLINTQFTMGKFSIKSTIGNSVRDNNYENVKIAALSLLVPIYNPSYNSSPPGVSQVKIRARYYSFFGTSTIGYKDWAFLEVTGRQDWDSKIATRARNDNYYYGVNSSIVLGEAIPSLLKNKYLSAIRLRASVNRTANMNIIPYQNESLLTQTNVYRDILSYQFDPRTIANPDIKPENIISQEYGVAAGFLKDRIGLDITYYRQRNNGVIGTRAISIFSGGDNILDNIGDFLNHGWEFDLKLAPLFKLPNGIAANLEGMLSINDNKVLAVNDQQLGNANGSGGGPTSVSVGDKHVIMVGGPAYAFRMTDWKKDKQGRVVVDRVTGMPSVDNFNPKIIGRSLPKYIGSFNFHLTWKNIGLHMIGEYRGGFDHYFRNATLFVMGGIDEMTAQYGRRRFVFPNSAYDDGTGKYVANTDVPVQSAQAGLYDLFSQVETNFLVSGAFWKLREISLSYNWKLKTKLIKQLAVTLAGRNLLRFYPKTNHWGDPELATGAGTVDREDQKAASNLNGLFSDGSIGGSRFLGINLTAGF